MQVLPPQPTIGDLWERRKLPRGGSGAEPRPKTGFYRAMHYSAKRGIAIACRLSVCPSVTLVDQDHIG